MVYLIGAVIVFFVVWGIVKAASGNRYANMTEEEFEEEAKRSSSVGGAVSALQKVFDASHHVEYVQEQQERVEADGAESGGPPKPVAPASPVPRAKS
jgi:hypothetical protein